MRIMLSRIAIFVLAAAAAACSPGTLPGSPSPIVIGGGGGKYNGSITYRRLGGNYTISEASQALSLSLALRDVNQIIGHFETGESSGTVQGVVRSTRRCSSRPTRARPARRAGAKGAGRSPPFSPART
jgi:hypothetical protein